MEADPPPDPLSHSLLRARPAEDAGAVTAHLYEFQQHCVLRLLLGALLRGQPLTIVCETHEDMLLLDQDGQVFMAVSVKHRDSAREWTRAELVSDGGLAKLHATWRQARQAIRAGLMTNCGLSTGRQGAALLLGQVDGEPDDVHAQRAWLAARLQCDEEEAGRFADRMRVTEGLPSRMHIGVVQVAQLLIPVLEADDLPTANADDCYQAALSLVRERSTDHDPLGQDLGLALLLEAGERQQREQDARVRARTITAGEVLERLRECARARAPRLPAPSEGMPESTMLLRKLRAGGLPHSALQPAATKRASWYAEQRRHDGLPGVEGELRWLRTWVGERAADAEWEASEAGDGEPFGYDMQRRLRQRLRGEAQELRDRRVLPSLSDPDLLEGCAYQLTDECSVMWSTPEALEAQRQREEQQDE